MKGSENLTDPSGYVWERRLKNQWRLKRSDGRADYFFFFLYVYDSEQLSGGGSGTVIAASAKQLG